MQTLQTDMIQQEEVLHKSLMEQRSEEVSYITKYMPTKFGWAVTGIVILLVGLMLLFGWLIKYPEVLQGQISISAQQANIKINANTTGKLELLKFKNGDTVQAGDDIGMIKNGAMLKDVELLDTLLQKVNIQQVNYQQHRKFFPENLILGELNTKYFVFLNTLYQYLDYGIEQPFRKQKEIGEQLLITQQKLKGDVLNQYDKLRKKMEIARSLTSRDSLLLKNKILSKAEYEKSLMNCIVAEQEFGAIGKDINNNNYQINEAANKLKQVNIQKMEKERELQVNLYNSYYDLKENIVEWKHRYVFTTPIPGRLDFMSFLKDEDFVQMGQELFTILPYESEIIGQMFLPNQGSGKVKQGQDVIIKLDDYPYKEFGSVKGKVKSVSLVSNQQNALSSQNTLSSIESVSTTSTKRNGYLVIVSLPKGLITNYGSQLPFHFESKGIGEIITNDRRLMQRLFDNLKYRLKKV